jgi:hypothetical protein
VSLPSTFFERGPRSLRRLVAGTNDPQVSSWEFIGNALSKPGDSLAPSAQGVATDGERWFVGTNRNRIYPTFSPGAIGVYAFDGRKLAEVEPSSAVLTEISRLAEDWPGEADLHFGPPFWTNGTLLVPVQRPDGVWVLTDSLSQQEWWPDPAPENLYSWLALEPGSGPLYSSVFDRPHKLAALRWRTLERVPEADIPLDRWEPFIDHVQGGVFTPSGRVLLACNDPPLLICVSALTGHRFGSLQLRSIAEEVEGLTIVAVPVHDVRGHRRIADVHILDAVTNNVPILDDDDDFYVRGYAATRPDDL